MWAKLFLLLAGLTLALPAQTRLTVEQLAKFLHSATELKQSDRDVAKYLRRQSMSERLDDSAIEELQGLGLGERTLEALRELRDASKALPAPPPPPPAATEQPPAAPAPGPPGEEQRKIIHQAREYALNYSKNLPNFICTQVTRRYYDPNGLEFWRQQDTLTARLSYFEQKEDYKLVLVNNRALAGDTPYHSVGGSISTGEFGSLMKEVFDPESDTDFRWERWGKLRGRVAHVYAYRVPQNRSKWTVNYEDKERITPGYHGLVYVDRDTGMVLRISLEADVPPTFPVQQVSDTLDYDLQPIGPQQYMLPLKAVIRSRSGRALTKNDVEFRLYRKFGAEAQIKYDEVTPEPLPEEKTQEEQPK
jgi:hypothetical protein